MWCIGLFFFFRMKFNMWSTEIMLTWQLRPPHIGTRKRLIRPPVYANERKKSKMASYITQVLIHKNSQWSAPSLGLYICSPTCYEKCKVSSNSSSTSLKKHARFIYDLSPKNIDIIIIPTSCGGIHTTLNFLTIHGEPTVSATAVHFF